MSSSRARTETWSNFSRMNGGRSPGSFSIKAAAIERPCGSSENPLSWPEPTKSAGSQQGIDQAIDNGLDRRDPGAPEPDGHLAHGSRVAEKGRDGRDVENGKVRRLPAQSASDNVTREVAYDRYVNEPRDEHLCHIRGSIWQYSGD